MAERRVIKKYQNRCLYDTNESCYISMNELKQMIYDETNFIVVESKTKKDITRCILLQIITEEENDNDPMFTSEMLMKFIRMHGESLQSKFSGYLENSLKKFEKQSTVHSLKL